MWMPLVGPCNFSFQVSTYMVGLFHSCLLKKVLSVVPKRHIAHWTKMLLDVDLEGKIREYNIQNIFY
jgi:DNA excision repair protein ERCC-6-like